MKRDSNPQHLPLEPTWTSLSLRLLRQKGFGNRRSVTKAISKFPSRSRDIFEKLSARLISWYGAYANLSDYNKQGRIHTTASVAYGSAGALMQVLLPSRVFLDCMMDGQTDRPTKNPIIASVMSLVIRYILTISRQVVLHMPREL